MEAPCKCIVIFVIVFLVMSAWWEFQLETDVQVALAPGNSERNPFLCASKYGSCKSHCGTYIRLRLHCASNAWCRRVTKTPALWDEFICLSHWVFGFIDPFYLKQHTLTSIFVRCIWLTLLVLTTSAVQVLESHLTTQFCCSDCRPSCGT